MASRAAHSLQRPGDSQLLPQAAAYSIWALLWAALAYLAISRPVSRSWASTVAAMSRPGGG